MDTLTRGNFREGFPYHSQCSNFTAIFDGNLKFLPSIDLEKFYGQLIKNFEMEGVSGNPRNPPKTAPAFPSNQGLKKLSVTVSRNLHFNAYLYEGINKTVGEFS